MASDRMKRAIGALERAVDRLEQDLNRLESRASPPSADGIDAAAARAALRSLDALIGEMKGSAHG